MSWNFAVHQINKSFDQIAHWYQEFMNHVQTSFRLINERIENLERRQDGQGPTDEQVERVLRKILAERFTGEGVQRFDGPNDLKDGGSVVKPPDGNRSVPRTISLDAASLQVDPDAIPSKAYGEVFQMLEKGLQDFPRVDVAESATKNSIPVRKSDDEFERPRHPAQQTDTKPW